MIDQLPRAGMTDAAWKSLYRAGGVAALLAALIFRRNLAAEVSLFTGRELPANLGDLLTLLQNNRLLGLTYLNIFDVANYLLLSVMFLALYVLLRRASLSYMTIATTLGLLGIAAYLASNTALSMLALSEQYAAASTEAQRTMVLAAGQTLLTMTRFSAPGAQPGATGYLSLLLVAVAGLMLSLVMLRSGVFNRVNASVGILASALDLAYCLAYVILPAADTHLLALFFIPAAGLFWMIWHTMTGVRLYRLGRREEQLLAQPA